MSNNKFLLLDLDGTVRQTKSGAKFINDREDQQLIYGVEGAIANCQGYQILGLTNQGGVASGFKTITSAIEEQKITLSLIPQMRLILFCPDMEGKELYMVSRENRGVKIDFEEQEKLCGHFGYDSFRKPGIGMIQYVQNTFTIDMSQSLFVGDMESDRECAEKAGVRFIWAQDWRKISNV